MSPRAGILTISDKGAAGEREDTSGAAIRELLGSIHATVERYEVIPDEQPKICERLRQWADGGQLDLIVTTGGTGRPSRRDTRGHMGSHRLRSPRPRGSHARRGA